MRNAAVATAVALACLSGCSSSPEEDQVKTAVAQLTLVTNELQATNKRIDKVWESLHQLDQDIKSDKIPGLQRDIGAIRSSLSNMDDLSGKAADLLSVMSRNGDAVVVREMVISDGPNATRCTLTPRGLVILNEKGRQVCEIQYEAQERAMTAELRGADRNSIALYAGDNRAAIGAFDRQDGGLAMEHRNDGKSTSTSLKLVKPNGEVGWAATVSPQGQVFAGRAR